MFGYRVAGVVIAGTCVLASALGAGVAFAQYEPVGKPLQLVPQAYSSKPAATPRNRVSARKAARSETRSESGSERPASLSEPAAETRTRQHASFRRKHRPHTEVAEQRRPQRPAAAASAETTAPTVTPAAAPRRAQAAPATAAAPAAAPAATAALPSQPNPAAAAPKSELVVGGQTVQVRSPNEANELDLAANEPSTTASAPANEPALSRGDAPLYNMAATVPPAENDAAPAAGAAPPAIAAPAIAAPAMEPAPADATKPKSAIGSAFWFMQIMAALGGAAAAGTAAWFLIGSASPRIKVSQWEADGEG